MLCLVLFTTAHADQHALCVTLLDLLTLFYFKFFISPNSQYFILSTVHMLSAPHKPHFRPGRVFCLLYTQLISGACREACVEERLKLLRALHCQREPALLPGASPLGLGAPSAFPLRCPGLKDVHKGDRQPLGGIWQQGESKNPSWLYTCSALHRVHEQRQEGRGERGHTGGGCPHQQKSPKPSLTFSFQRIHCSSTLKSKSSLLFVI